MTENTSPSENFPRYVTFFPWGDFTPSGGHIVYGLFDSLEAAQAHARTLSSDPTEGQVARVEPPR